MKPTNNTQKPKTTFENNLFGMFSTTSKVIKSKEPTTPKVKETKCPQCNTQTKDKGCKKTMLQFIDIIFPEINKKLTSLELEDSSEKLNEEAKFIQKDYVTPNPEICYKEFISILQGLYNNDNQYCNLSHKISKFRLTYIILFFDSFLKKITFDFKNTKDVINLTIDFLGQVKKKIQEDKKLINTKADFHNNQSHQYFYMSLAYWLGRHEIEIPDHLFKF